MKSKILKRDELIELYNSNEDFREYVDKYRQRDNITVDEALMHSMVWEKAKDMFERGIAFD